MEKTAKYLTVDIVLCVTYLTANPEILLMSLLRMQGSGKKGGCGGGGKG